MHFISGSWRALPAIKGSILSLNFLNVDDGPGEHVGYAYSNGLRQQPCLVAGGQFEELQTNVVWLCLQNSNADFAPNPFNMTGNSNTSRTDAGASSSSAKNNPMSTSFWPFAEAWEASHSANGIQKETLVVSAFSTT